MFFLYRYFEENWDDLYFHPEIFFPKKLVSCYPWGECRSLEDDGPQTIYSISHITHRKEVRKIDTGGQFYCFQPSQKYGKCGYDVTDGSPLGESYRCDLKGKTPTDRTKYTPILREELVFPGFYLWWGPSSTTSSMYGTEKLTANFKSVLRKFQWSRKEQDAPNLPDVYLRVRGTLRYKKEICYVILIHTDNEATEEIKRLPPLEDSRHFKLNEFLDDCGRVADWDTYPAFIPRFYEDGCKDHFAFAFYFSDRENPLKLDKEKVTRKHVDHTRCLRSFKVKPEFQPDPSRSWYCPEDPSLPKEMSLAELTADY